jgi:hypothetical protein
MEAYVQWLQDMVDGKPPIDPGSSICVTIYDHFKEVSFKRNFPIIVSLWSGFERNCIHPIRDPEDPRTAKEQFKFHTHNETLWEGKQGELRRDLCRHLLEAEAALDTEVPLPDNIFFKHWYKRKWYQTEARALELFKRSFY